MGQPKVFVVTINWNGLADTLQCLESLVHLDYPNVETIVVDNASANDQAETIAERFPEAIILSQEENLGFCGGCNVGIQHALAHGAEYVLLLNNDAIVTPSFLTKLVGLFDIFADAGAASPLVCEYPDTSKIWYARPRWISREAYFVLKEPDDAVEFLEKKDAYAVEFTTGCCMLVPARVFESEGLLDERYFAYYDEVEWCFRIRRSGFACYVAPNAVVYHKERRSTPGPVHDYLVARNRLLWMKEYLPFGERLRSAKYLAKEWLWHQLNARGLTAERIPRGSSRALVRGYRDYFRGRFFRWEPDTEKQAPR